MMINFYFSPKDLVSIDGIKPLVPIEGISLCHFFNDEEMSFENDFIKTNKQDFLRRKVTVTLSKTKNPVGVFSKASENP